MNVPEAKSPKTPLEESTLALHSRRSILRVFLRASAVAAMTGVGGLIRLRAQKPEPSPPELPNEEPPAGSDPLITMQYQLKKALQKPVKERRWVMVIDLRKCVGCHACTVACIAENKLPPGVVYRPVLDEEIGTYPNVSRRFVPRPCMQCDVPPCVPVCPVNATWKGEDGIVHIDYEKCIGCRYCLTACPYGARTFDFGEFYSNGTPRRAEYDEAPSFEYGKRWDRGKKLPILGEIAPKSPIGNARKCHFCVHRINKGMLPMCVTSCIGRATYFGDANDPESLVAKLISKPNVMRLKEELGTEPRVYYLT